MGTVIGSCVRAAACRPVGEGAGVATGLWHPIGVGISPGGTDFWNAVSGRDVSGDVNPLVSATPASVAVLVVGDFKDAAWEVSVLELSALGVARRLRIVLEFRLRASFSESLSFKAGSPLR